MCDTGGFDGVERRLRLRPPRRRVRLCTPPHHALALRFNLHLMNKVVREFARRAANVYLSWRSLPSPADKNPAFNLRD